MSYMGVVRPTIALTSADIADDAVITAKINDDAVTAAKIATNAVDTAEIAADAVEASELADDAVDTAAVADNAITLAKMAGLVRGKIIVGDSSGDPSALTVGSANQVLTSDGTDAAWAAASGTTINNNAAYSVIVGSGTANTLEAESGLTYNTPGATDFAVNTNDFFVDGSVSRVGIGTTSPDEILDIDMGSGTNNADMPMVQGSGTEAGWQMNCTGTGGKNWHWHSTGGTSGAGQGNMILYNVTDATVAVVVTSTGNVGITGGTTAFTPSSTLTVTGSVSKSSGSFQIDHPLPAKKDTHWLVHSFVESPKADLIYRDKVDLVNGSATVNIDTAAGMTDGTFVLLCDDVQCFTSNETDWDAVKGSVSGNILTIECQNTSSTATISWMVIGDRKDEHMTDSGTSWTDGNGKPIVEPLKEELVEPPLGSGSTYG